MKAGDSVFARCEPLLARVDSADLDCVCDNVALLLAHAGVADVRTPFALDWRFDLIDGSGGLPRLDLPPADLPELLAQRNQLTQLVRVLMLHRSPESLFGGDGLLLQRGDMVAQRRPAREAVLARHRTLRGG